MSAKLKTSFEFVDLPDNSPITQKKEYQVGFFVGSSFRCKARFETATDAFQYSLFLKNHEHRPIKIYSFTLYYHEL